MNYEFQEKLANLNDEYIRVLAGKDHINYAKLEMQCRLGRQLRGYIEFKNHTFHWQLARNVLNYFYGINHNSWLWVKSQGRRDHGDYRKSAAHYREMRMKLWKYLRDYTEA